MIPGEYPEASLDAGGVMPSGVWPDPFDGEHEHPPVDQYDLQVHRENMAEYRDLHAERWLRMVGPRHAAASMGMLPDRVRGPVAEWTSAGLSGKPCGALVLFGPVGTGKTFTACAILRRWYDDHRHVEYWQAAELFDALRPSHAENPEAEPPETVLDRVKRARLLVLDDLADERQTEWVRERLDVIVGYRHRIGLPIVITTNARPDVLAEHVGARIASRLREDGGRAIAMGGNDRRAS